MKASPPLAKHGWPPQSGLRALPPWAWAPLASGAVLGIIGLLGWWAGVPWLFASLGPTLAMQTMTPDHPAARPWNVAAGHMIGLGTGFLAVYVTWALGAPPVSDSNPLTGVRVASAVLALAAGLFLEPLAKAQHPPAAATTLLVALGITEPNGEGAITIVCGVALVTFFGELVRRARLQG